MVRSIMPHLVFCTRLVNCLKELPPPESHPTCNSKHNLHVIIIDPVYSAKNLSDLDEAAQGPKERNQFVKNRKKNGAH